MEPNSYHPYSDQTESQSPRGSYPRPRSNSMATAALVLGILAICTGFLTGIGGVLFGGLGILIAILSRGYEPMESHAKIGLGLSATGLVMGLIVTVLAFTVVWYDFPAIYDPYDSYQFYDYQQPESPSVPQSDTGMDFI